MSETSDWTADHIVVNGRHVRPGVELAIEGLGSRRFRFLSWDPRGWINVWGGPPNQQKMRSFAPERIVQVHRTVKMTTSQMPKPPRKVTL